MKEIPLTQGKVAIVDDDDFHRISLFSWNAHLKGHIWYAQRNAVNSKGCRTVIEMHNMILLPRKGFLIDHRNGDGLDNRKENLRYATRSQNQQNRHRSWGRSHFKGVSFDMWSKKWVARIQVEGRQLNLGRFENEIDAALAYNRGALLYFGGYAALNEVAE